MGSVKMIGRLKKILLCGLVFFLFVQVAFAAENNETSINNVRFSQRAEAVRVVFDVDQIPQYKVQTDKSGTKITIDFKGTKNKSNLIGLPIDDVLIKNITFSEIDQNSFRATFELNRNALYKVNVLQNPNRIFIDFIKNYEQKLIDQVEPGLKHITIIRGNEKGMLTVNVLDIDLSYGFRLRPVLAKDKILERETLSSMAKRYKALGAVNASYFDASGEILGLTKIDSTIASTTYLTRSGFGILKDGQPIIGQIDYNGTVEFGKGKTLSISGVNSARGENALILYNPYYDTSTKTNIYGKEYVVKDDHVIEIREGDSPLAQGTVVLSAHGTSADQLAMLEVGDPIKIKEDLGNPWNNATQILGVGPMLVKDNSIYLTTKNEEFGPDVAGGRAPRTAVGITKDNHVLLVVVDGRQTHSIGCTLLELALLLQELGATDAVNFDGGGSSEMVIKNDIINSPSDGGERRIGSSMVVLSK